jgi:hypothetical protein
MLLLMFVPFRSLHCLVMRVLTFATLAAFPFFAFSAEPMLEWDANTEPDVAGYRVYFGEKPGVYEQSVDVGAETSYVLSDLDPGVTFYFAITAYTVDGLESDFSDEISYTAAIDGVTAALSHCDLINVNGNASVRFSAALGQVCTVLASSDLRAWHEVYRTTAAQDGEIVYDDGPMQAGVVRFFRVVLSPP